MNSRPPGPAHVFGGPPPGLVAFDLDGTLVDSVPDIAWCLDRTMPRFGVPPRGETLVRDWVGNGVERLIDRALTGEMDGTADPGLRHEACAAFLDLYSTHGHEHSRVYPGVREGLGALRVRGAALACITNKPHGLAVDLLARVELLGHFELVLGGDSLPRRKPDPLPLIHACARLGIAVEHSLFVGDSVSDVEAARAAGMRVACVGYGYNHGRDVSEAGPDAVVGSLEELIEPCFGSSAAGPAAGRPGRCHGQRRGRLAAPAVDP